MSSPVEVLYFYRTRWGAHDEFVDAVPQEPLADPARAVGRRPVRQRGAVHPALPWWRRRDWDVLVSITYRDWAAIQEHSDGEIVRRLYPDQEAFAAEERRRFELLEAHWDVVLEPQALER